MALDKVTTAVIADDAVTSDQLGVGAIAGTDIAADVIEVKPHIKPGILHPAVAGKDLSGTALGGSYVYGTAHTDGRSYYYTDIKGSKPIKDPRIGSYFGSQRYKAKSVQLLEQETATHGKNVYSIDGREWFRAVSSDLEGWHLDLGTFIGSSNHTFTTFFEIVGYFNDFNCMSRLRNDRADDINVTVNGGTTRNSANTDKLAGRSVQNSPLRNRFVDAPSIINHGDDDVTSDLGTTPRINTIKIEAINTGSEYWQFFGIELIAQDTTSTANRSKIQIPAQNAVSYGKKFSISAATPHYDPFNGFTSGNLAAVQALIDTSTSLGMANWLSSSTYYRPFNGGRVVKWVDSSGTIKTSVTMMPPNAQNIAGSASNAHTLGAANDQTINFDTTTIANASPLFEVAKTFMALEFGNGSANAGTGQTLGPDPTMLHSDGTADDVAYVMDDGLTSLFADNAAKSASALSMNADNDYNIFTFIGTGVSINDPNGDSPGQYYPAQNLPYSTHILQSTRKSGTDAVEFVIDGINLGTQTNCTKGRCEEITFYQPKMPPIPEDACIIADYMLMADFVVQTGHGKETLSKGVRCNWASRDFFYDSGAAQSLEGPHTSVASGYRLSGSNNNEKYIEFPTFCHGFVARFLANTDRSANTTYKVNDDVYDTNFNASGTYTAGNRIGTTSPNPWDTSNNDGTVTFDHNGNGTDNVEFAGIKNLQLGLNKLTFDDNTTDYIVFDGVEVVTPIHTSLHYQEFETPFLKELIGGDRNMEQTNLVVTHDGKTWDEVTRDTSYIGKCVVSTTRNSGAVTSASTVCVMEEWRGTVYGRHHYFNKDFAISYDRIICLVAGQYELHGRTISRAADGHAGIKINGTAVMFAHSQGDSHDTPHNIIKVDLVRGDYITVMGHWYNSDYWAHFNITRL